MHEFNVDRKFECRQLNLAYVVHCVYSSTNKTEILAQFDSSTRGSSDRLTYNINIHHLHYLLKQLLTDILVRDIFNDRHLQRQINRSIKRHKIPADDAEQRI